MPRTIPNHQMDQIVAYVMNQHADNLRELLLQHGYASAPTLPKKDLQIAFLKAVKDSPSFRQDASLMFSRLVDAGNFGFVSQPGNALSFVNQPSDSLNMTDAGKPLGSTKLSWTGAAAAASTAAANTPTTQTNSTTTTKSGFGATLGSLFNTQNLNSLFNTGLNALSTKLSSDAQKGSEERALELERLRLQQIQAQTDLAANGGLNPQKGLSAGAIVGIAAGATVLLVVVMVLVMRKK